MSCIIQKPIKVSEEFIEETIASYEKHDKKYHLCFGDFSGNKDDIIREIKKRSEVGKQILLMRHNFIEKFPDVYKEMKKRNQN